MVKTTNHTRRSTLQVLPIAQQAWSDIGIDFITSLSQTATGKDAILTVVCRLTRRVRLFAVTTTITAKESARILSDHIFPVFGVCTHCTSDRDSKFTSELFQEVAKAWGVRLLTTTSHRAQGNGVTEVQNKTIVSCLRAIVNDRGGSWDEWLPLAEMAINSSVCKPTGETPYFADLGRYPKMPTDLALPPLAESSAAARAQQHLIKERFNIIKDRLRGAQLSMERQYNDTAVPRSFKKDDLVLVDADVLVPPGHKPAKLERRWHGPYSVIAPEGPNSYRLRLPKRSRAHPVVNVEFLKAFRLDSYPGRRPPAVTDADGETRYVIEKITERKLSKGVERFLVYWSGYTEPTWEPREHLTDETTGKPLAALDKFLKEAAQAAPRRSQRNKENRPLPK
eukprot:m.43479 g.43479  ORF g.43479 m.43479 type:complete len:395 (-) comp12223_c0_seq4:280-1464(-)